MKRHLQCAEQEASSSNLTKYCACHVKRISSLIRVTYETSFTMRGATSIALQRHQILRLPRKKSLVFDPRHIWNVIYNARSNKHHPPTSPNAAPATKNDTHHWLSSHMKRHLQCAEQQASPSNLTKYCACHAKLHSKIKEKFAENSWSVNSNARPIRAWSEHDQSMIRPWTRHLAPARSPRLLFALRRRILYWKLQHFALRLSTQISPNTVPATKNDTPTSPNAAPATKSDTPRSPNTAPATKSSTPRSPNAAPATKSQLLLSCYSTELLLSCYSTELLLNCYSTELLLNCYWTELLLNCYWTELNLLLKWAVTELLLNWAEPVTQVSCYWTVTQVSCYWTVTQLSCYWTVTQLSWTWAVTELLLKWAVTELLLNWAVTELLLNWAVTEL